MDLGCLRHTCFRICCGTPVGPGRGTGYRGPLFCEWVPKTFWGMVQKKAADTQRLRDFYRLICRFPQNVLCYNNSKAEKLSRGREKNLRRYGAHQLPILAIGNMARLARQSTRPRIVDVAREAGVSVTTVSHALNGRGFVDPATRERVKETARKLGYRPNLHAQRLRGGGAHTIVLFSSMPFAVAAGPSRLGFLMEVAAVAAAAALTRGLALVLAPPLEAAQLPLDVLDVDGALVVEPALQDRNVDYLLERGVPIVSVGKQPGAVHAIPYVDIHSATTTRLLLQHLYSQEARRIALVIGSACRNSYIEAEATYRCFAQETDMP